MVWRVNDPSLDSVQTESVRRSRGTGRLLLDDPDVHFIVLSIGWALPRAGYRVRKMNQTFFLCSGRSCPRSGHTKSQCSTWIPVLYEVEGRGSLALTGRREAVGRLPRGGGHPTEAWMRSFQAKQGVEARWGRFVSPR